MLIYSDYLHESKIIAYYIKENYLKEIYLCYQNLISYGKLNFDYKNKENIEYFSKNTYLLSLNGYFYSTNIIIKLLLFKI